jgi:hypothetical protein
MTSDIFMSRIREEFSVHLLLLTRNIKKLPAATSTFRLFVLEIILDCGQITDQKNS